MEIKSLRQTWAIWKNKDKHFLSSCWSQKPIANLKLKFLFRRGVARVGQQGDVLLHFSKWWFRNQDGFRALASSSHTAAQCSAISLDDGTLMARMISVTKQNTELQPNSGVSPHKRLGGASQHSLSARTLNEMIGKDLSMRICLEHFLVAGL